MPIDAKRVEKALEEKLADVQHQINLLIAITPSGEKRNFYTDVNIHIMQSADALKKAQHAVEQH